MVDFELKFLNLNVSLQVGDMLYYVKTEDLAEFEKNLSSVTQLDVVKSITTSNGVSTVVFDLPNNTEAPTADDYILFSKDSLINTSSILGYYGIARFKNNSSNKTELRSVSCEISTSSK